MYPVNITCTGIGVTPSRPLLRHPVTILVQERFLAVVTCATALPHIPALASPSHPVTLSRAVYLSATLHFAQHRARHEDHAQRKHQKLTPKNSAMDWYAQWRAQKPQPANRCPPLRRRSRPLTPPPSTAQRKTFDEERSTRVCRAQV